MEFKKLLEIRSEESWKKYIPTLYIDCVIFSFHENELQVLLLKLRDREE
ncbi:hypothetical protein [Flavobacterium sp. LM4]